ncbi:hypothetical protein E2R51_13855 [Jeotgalibacillus sp. S-D1]|uniref:hypothetical protein n=1 Tax=Jeotgalibacillus sp. S-D1 TaxID=2552189 RepID=UPI00105A0D00|nr:hypothetical protein [Jeotgalibacillus sp. S-D1]TDL31445.1 hypothetical protein E2R51_13855 [Jeotgalibacillus sp. S-D1]
MTHYTKQQWKDYVQGELDSLTERKMEDHITTCMHCLSSYEETTERFSPSMDFSVEKQVMTAILSEQLSGHKPVKKSAGSAQRKTVTHFFISAAAALMLASTGVFSSFMDETSLQEEEEFKEAPSITSSLLEQTERLFIQMDPSPKEESE